MLVLCWGVSYFSSSIFPNLSNNGLNTGEGIRRPMFDYYLSVNMKIQFPKTVFLLRKQE